MSNADGITNRLTMFIDELASQGVEFRLGRLQLGVVDPHKTITQRQEHVLRTNKWPIMLLLHMHHELKEEENKEETMGRVLDS